MDEKISGYVSRLGVGARVLDTAHLYEGEELECHSASWMYDRRQEKRQYKYAQRGVIL